MQSIWEDDYEAVENWLSENKDQVMMRDSHGYAPIHYAAKFNRPEIMEMLVKRGAGTYAIQLNRRRFLTRTSSYVLPNFSDTSAQLEGLVITNYIFSCASFMREK